jgi:hypothetical protein
VNRASPLPLLSSSPLFLFFLGFVNKMGIQWQVGAYIAAGGGVTSRPPKRAGCPSVDLPPVGRAGRPAGRLRALFANKKSFLFAKRPSGGARKRFWDLPPVGWAGGPRPHASRPLIGREIPISQKFANRHPFFEFNFFYFFQKNSHGCAVPRLLVRSLGVAQHGPLPLLCCASPVKSVGHALAGWVVRVGPPVCSCMSPQV